MDKYKLGKNLHKARILAHLTQPMVGQLLGTNNHSQISRWESGENEIPANKLIQLCYIYQVSPNEILEW